MCSFGLNTYRSKDIDYWDQEVSHEDDQPDKPATLIELLGMCDTEEHDSAYGSEVTTPTRNKRKNNIT